MRMFLQQIEDQLPFMRRYARAACGSRESGDRATEEAIVRFLSDKSNLHEDEDLRVILFRTLQEVRQTIEAGTREISGGSAEARANRHLSDLAPDGRDAFLLSAFERFSPNQIATILRCTADQAEGLITVARENLANMATGRVLVIEDELFVADDISTIVSEMGHSVIGTALTHEDALEIADTTPPDLILSDIQLANGASGISAVNDILLSHPMTPVVYITGFPERLLTGKGPEPAFLVTKPYTRDQIRSAISQAMFFA